MNKEKKDQLKEILKKPELSRLDASILISELFTSPEDCASSIFMNGRQLREQINATKPFLKQTSDLIKAESLKRLSPKKIKAS